MNSKGVVVISSVGLVIIGMIFLSNNTIVPPPQIIDDTLVKDDTEVGVDSTTQNTEIEDGVFLEFNDDQNDEPKITDYVIIEQKDGVSFYIDENGTKHYIITATDTPMLGK